METGPVEVIPHDSESEDDDLEIVSEAITNGNCPAPEQIGPELREKITLSLEKLCAFPGTIEASIKVYATKKNKNEVSHIKASFTANGNLGQVTNQIVTNNNSGNKSTVSTTDVINETINEINDKESSLEESILHHNDTANEDFGSISEDLSKVMVENDFQNNNNTSMDSLTKDSIKVSQSSPLFNRAISVSDDCEESVDSFNPLANFSALMSFTDPYIEDELAGVTTSSSVQKSVENENYPQYDDLASPIKFSRVQTKRDSLEGAKSSSAIICRNARCKKKLKLKDSLKLDITRISSDQQEQKPWRLSEDVSRNWVRPLSPFSSFLNENEPSNDIKIKECDKKPKECGKKVQGKNNSYLKEEDKGSISQGIEKRLGRGKKRKTMEAVNQADKKSRDQSPDLVCEDCGTIFVSMRSYTRHRNLKTGCAKVLEKIFHKDDKNDSNILSKPKAKTKRISASYCLNSLSQSV